LGSQGLARAASENPADLDVAAALTFSDETETAKN
jgi:hypothetical protein